MPQKEHKGRKPGTPNKVGTELRERLAQLTGEYAGLDPDSKEYDSFKDKVKQALDGLLDEGEWAAFIDAWNKLRKAAVPDLKAVEHSYKEVPVINITPVGQKPQKRVPESE